MSQHPPEPDIKNRTGVCVLLIVSRTHCPVLVLLKSQNTRCSNNPEVLTIVLETDWRYYLELKLLSPVLNQSSILRHQMNNTKLERHRRLLWWWAWPGLESGPGSQFTMCSQHMRAINPQSDHYILITTSANDYQLCQDAEREAADSKETLIEQSSVKCEALHEEMVCGAVGTFLVSTSYPPSLVAHLN